MVDIRQKVEDDQGLLKKLQKAIPGYRGYRIRDDLRDSDKMLRGELAKRMALQRKQVEECRMDMIRSAPMSRNLEAIGGVIMQFKKVEGLLYHAELGYSGIGADIQIKADELNQMYDYDNSMLENIAFMDQGISELRVAVSGRQEDKVSMAISDVRMRLSGFEEKFQRRLATIQGIGV
ncbi:MAG: hypothetical protein WCK39_00840 [Methanomassiliicoccales archaeon]